MSERESGSGALLAFLAGAAAGAAVALLLAPRSGEETRERLASWYEDARERGRDLYARGASRLEGLRKPPHEDKA